MWGEAAVGRIEDFLFRNALDIATVLGRVEEALRAVQDGCRKSDEIKASLEDCVPSETELPDEILIRVSFTNAASISNIVDLKRWSREWHDIARGIAMAHGASPESIRVVGAGKGSIVVDLAVIYAIAKTREPDPP